MSEYVGEFFVGSIDKNGWKNNMKLVLKEVTHDVYGKFV